MEVVFYAHSVNVIGGAERVTLSIINGVKQTYQPVMLAPAGETLAHEAVSAGAIFEPIDCLQPEKLKPLKTLKQLFKYYQLFKKYQPKLVHTGDLLALRSLQPICKLLKIPMICHVHFPYEIPFMRWAFKNRYAPQSFIFCSNELKMYLQDELTLLCPSSQLEVIHNGVNIEKFKPITREPNPIPRIGIIANLQYRKGHDDFLAMAKILLDQGVKAQFDIIGGDILEEPRELLLKQKAIELGIAENVVFHGQVANVLEHLQQLDIVVCASHEEAFPISILEAMACGKAIVSTNVNGIPEAIIDGETGILVASHSPHSLATAIIKVLQSPKQQKLFILNGRRRVIDLFSSSIFKSKINNLYQNL